VQCAKGPANRAGYNAFTPSQSNFNPVAKRPRLSKR
jgi:hypothetical protein